MLCTSTSRVRHLKAAGCSLQLTALSQMWLLTTVSSFFTAKAKLTGPRMASKHPIEKSDTRYNILAFGDSLTEGYYNRGLEFHPYSIKLRELLAGNGYDVKVHERGHSGERVVRGMDSRLPALLRQFERSGVRLDWVIILGGINDLGYGAAPDDVYRGLLSLYDACHRHGAQVLALTCLQTQMSLGDSPDQRTRLNDLIRSTRNKRDYVTVLDLEDLLPFPRSRQDVQAAVLWDDHLHLTPDGYDTLGRLVYDVLHEKLQADG